MESSKLYEAIKANDVETLQSLVADPETDLAQRDSEGRGFLHHAVLEGAELPVLEILVDHVDLAMKDNDGNTFLDQITPGSPLETIRDAVYGKVTNLILNGGEKGEKEAERLLLAGWSHLPVILETAREKAEETVHVVDKLLDLQDKVGQAHKAVEEGRLEDVKELFAHKVVATAVDPSGLPPLHRAVLRRQKELVKYLSSEFADLINATDYMGRTALHYAAALTDDNELYTILKDAGADDTIKDLAGKTPVDYQQHPELLPVADIMKRMSDASLAQSASSTAADIQQTAQTTSGADADTQQTAQVTSGADADAQQTAQSVSGAAADTEQVAQATSGAEAEPAEPEQSGQSATQQLSQDADTITAPPTQSPTSSPPSEPAKPAQVVPVNMYVRGAETERAPPPTTVDGKYVSQHLGHALTLALAEIVEKRPWDPIEYLGQWLYKYRKNLDEVEQQRALLEEIRAEEEAANEAEVIKFKKRQEELKIMEEERQRREEEEAERKKREQEELQRQAKEAMLAQKPLLPTVAEEVMEDTLFRERDEQGQTELHLLASQSGADLMAVMNLGYSLADRDINNKTPRDLAEEQGLTENVETIDNYVGNLLEQEKLDTLCQLILDGYDKMDAVLEKVSTEGLPENVTDFVKSIPQLQKQVAATFRAVCSGVAGDVENCLQTKNLVLAKDVYGRSPLHLAILAGHDDIAKYIIENFPISMKTRDNMNRTPLHYASALSEQLNDLLKESGADVNVKDAKQHTPSFYKDEKEEIEALKDTLPVPVPESSGDITVPVPQITADDDNQQQSQDQQAADSEPNAEQPADDNKQEPTTATTTVE